VSNRKLPSSRQLPCSTGWEIKADDKRFVRSLISLKLFLCSFMVDSDIPNEDLLYGISWRLWDLALTTLIYDYYCSSERMLLLSGSICSRIGSPSNSYTYEESSSLMTLLQSLMNYLLLQIRFFKNILVKIVPKMNLNY